MLDERRAARKTGGGGYEQSGRAQAAARRDGDQQRLADGKGAGGRGGAQPIRRSVIEEDDRHTVHPIPVEDSSRLRR